MRHHIALACTSHGMTLYNKWHYCSISSVIIYPGIIANMWYCNFFDYQKVLRCILYADISHIVNNITAHHWLPFTGMLWYARCDCNICNWFDLTLYWIAYNSKPYCIVHDTTTPCHGLSNIWTEYSFKDFLATLSTSYFVILHII